MQASTDIRQWISHGPCLHNWHAGTLLRLNPSFRSIAIGDPALCPRSGAVLDPIPRRNNACPAARGRVRIFDRRIEDPGPAGARCHATGCNRRVPVRRPVELVHRRPRRPSRPGGPTKRTRPARRRVADARRGAVSALQANLPFHPRGSRDVDRPDNRTADFRTLVTLPWSPPRTPTESSGASAAGGVIGDRQRRLGLGARRRRFGRDVVTRPTLAPTPR